MKELKSLLMLLWLVIASPLAWATNYDVVVGGDDGCCSFTPNNLTINVGDTVTWKWAGDATHAHNVVASGLFRCAQGCDGEGGNGNPTAAAWTVTRTFSSAGTVNYFCEVHQAVGMKGTITVAAGGGTPTTATAVEYYYAGWNMYFVTAFSAEIAALDGGAFGGLWKRTGETFSVWTDASGGGLQTCRFFSTIFDPKSSHFYTPYANECASLKAGNGWQYEGIAFYIQLPEGTGNCPAGTTILYRLYNNGMGGAPNHRFTVSATTFSDMQTKGWIFEGDGRTGAFACVPVTAIAASAPTAKRVRT